jgi:alpha-galactosidase
VQGTGRLLSHWAGVPYDEVRYRVAGINHQAWFLAFMHGEVDLYPRLRERVTNPIIRGEEPVRIALMDHFGYFVTESSGHASEYVPYLRKSSTQIEALVEQFRSPNDHWFDWGRTGGYLKHCRELLPTYLDEVRSQVAGVKPLPSKRSDEYGAGIINAMETNEPFKFNGNVPNAGLITNLPAGCCVEVPCLADSMGVQPTVVGALPPQLAALNRAMIAVQELATLGGLHRDREAVHQAVLLDPLTAAVCDLDAAHRMVDDLFAAEAGWLPQFA